MIIYVCNKSRNRYDEKDGHMDKTPFTALLIISLMSDVIASFAASGVSSRVLFVALNFYGAVAQAAASPCSSCTGTVAASLGFSLGLPPFVDRNFGLMCSANESTRWRSAESAEPARVSRCLLLKNSFE